MVAENGGQCSTVLAGYLCDRTARFALAVHGREVRLCAPCHDASLSFLIDRGVHAAMVDSRPLATDATTPETTPEPEPTATLAASKPGTRVLLIEDDARVGSAIAASLTRCGYDVTTEQTGLGGLRAAFARRPDVVLLDLGLPDVDGSHVLRSLRAVSDVPIIVVSARGDQREVVAGLTLGADDYLVKPFALPELVARIERTQRSRRATEGASAQVYDDGLLRLDPARLEARVAGEPVRLSRTEFLLLETLVRNAGAVQPADTLFRNAWTDPTGDADDRVKFAVSRLRRKLDATALGSAPIVSARGVGYVYRPPDRTAEKRVVATGSEPGPAGEARQAVLADRRRIARDLHDVVVQRLFAIGLGLEEIATTAEPAARDRLTAFVQELDQTNGQIRRAIYSLEQEPDHLGSLDDHVHRCVQEYVAMLGFAPRVTIEGPLDAAVAGVVRQDLTATLREALSNAARHARASAMEIDVRIDSDRTRLTLSVVDDGTGPPAAYPRRGGLANMAARAERWGGRLGLGRAPGGGTALLWTVPLPTRSAPQPST